MGWGGYCQSVRGSEGPAVLEFKHRSYRVAAISSGAWNWIPDALGHSSRGIGDFLSGSGPPWMQNGTWSIFVKCGDGARNKGCTGLPIYVPGSDGICNSSVCGRTGAGGCLNRELLTVG